MDKTLLHKISLLIVRMLGIDTEEEHVSLKKACQENAQLEQLINSLTDPEEYTHRQRLLQTIDSEQELLKFLKNRNSQRRRLGKIYRWTAAAILVLGIGSAWLLLKPFQDKQVQYADETTAHPAEKEAVLVLSDGSSQDLLQSVGMISESNGSLILNDSTQLNYTHIPPASNNTAIPAINHLIVGRGFEYMLILQDGTKVWMNAESRLDYPIHFAAGPRRVNLTGEAYFEVAGDSTRPFIVEVNNSFEVKVLGTHFNIKAYTTDDYSETTLVEGKVSISAPTLKENIILTPSQQMVIGKNGESRVREVDTDNAIDWHYGWFFFDNETLEKTLEKVGRWYNIDFQFADPQCKDICVSGKIKRFENLQVILNMLKTTTRCNFIQDNQTIYITKNNRK